MKLMFISDIHGSLDFLQESLKIYKEESASNLVILGDILYHGPRNPLPSGYNPKSVCEILNGMKSEIIAIRGNCDSEVDQMVLDFPMMCDYSYIFVNGRKLFLTHGHIFNENILPNLSPGDVLLHGHTHIPVARKHEEIFIINPGSISLPKENTPNSYAVYENDTFTIKDFKGNILKQIIL